MVENEKCFPTKDCMSALFYFVLFCNKRFSQGQNIENVTTLAGDFGNLAGSLDFKIFWSVVHICTYVVNSVNEGIAAAVAHSQNVKCHPQIIYSLKSESKKTRR